VCGILESAGSSNELFRFSTTENKWEQLNATRVSGSPPSAREDHGMASVGSDLYVFGGYSRFAGEEGLCDDGHRVGACPIERRAMLHAMRLCLLPHAVLERGAMQCRTRVW
jgi:hypothetical protein